MDNEIRNPRVFVDPTVLRLGKWLRYLGLDVPVARSPKELPRGAFLLTRKRRMAVDSGQVAFVPHDKIEKQLSWFVRRFPGLIDRERIGSRCIRCNRLLEEIPREEARNRVPDYVFMTHATFKVCPECGRYYWSGSHSDRMRAFLEEKGIEIPEGGQR